MTDFMFVTKQRSFAFSYFKSPFLIVRSLAPGDIQSPGGVSYWLKESQEPWLIAQKFLALVGGSLRASHTPAGLWHRDPAEPGSRDKSTGVHTSESLGDSWQGDRPHGKVSCVWAEDPQVCGGYKSAGGTWVTESKATQPSPVTQL